MKFSGVVQSIGNELVFSSSSASWQPVMVEQQVFGVERMFATFSGSAVVPPCSSAAKTMERQGKYTVRIECDGRDERQGGAFAEKERVCTLVDRLTSRSCVVPGIGFVLATSINGDNCADVSQLANSIQVSSQKSVGQGGGTAEAVDLSALLACFITQ